MTDSVHSANAETKSVQGRDEGGPAFPVEHLREEGMSLRDYFAAKALQGNLDAQVDPSFWKPSEYDHLALDAYKVADAKLKARK